MEFSSSSFEKRPAGDALAIPFVKVKGKGVLTLKGIPFKKALKGALDAGDFTAGEGELLWIYDDAVPERRIVLVGLGEEKNLDKERLRRAYGALARASLGKKLKKVNVCLPEGLALPAGVLVPGIAEGMLLTNYSFKGKRRDADKQLLLRSVSLVGATRADVLAAKRCAAISRGVYLARDLVNGNADDVTPQHLAEIAKKLAGGHGHLKATIYDKKRLAKEGFGLLLAVARGSSQDPSLIVLEYKGNPSSKEKVVLVGKGITYDTGGLNLKPTGSMETMRADMGGAAALLGVMSAVTALGLKKNVTVVIPSCENCIDASSYKPGDVYTGYAGKSVEINNTDAEGRLVLADALAYAVKTLKPTRLIDIATLTGAMDVALGNEHIGLFCNNDVLATSLEKAGAATYERVWRLPLVGEYREQLKSDIADLKNMGGRGGGSIKAALFLEEFVGSVPWAHLDIAAVAFAAESRRYLPKHGTGVGVRLLVEYLQH